MKIISGDCTLIIDGRRFDGCTCALDKDRGPTRSFGFLSASSEVLKKAQAARRVAIISGEHPPLEITVLAVNAGIALFAVSEAKPIHVTLRSKGWVSVVEAANVRDLCIRAEKQLRESGPANAPVDYQVVGGERQQAAAIVEYLKGVELSLVDPDHMPISTGVIHTLQLAMVERYIGRAERLVAAQHLRVEIMKQRGWPDDLSSRLLDSLTTSLALLIKHRDLVRRELVQVE